MRLAWVILPVVGVAVIDAAQGLNPCLDPTSESFVCAPGTNQIDISGCGITEDDAEDLEECLTAARRAGVTELKLGDTGDTTPLALDDEFFAMLDMRQSNDEDRRQIFSSDGDDQRSLAQIEVSEGTFLQLATQRFDARIAASGLPVEANWNFPNLQLVRIPKAGSSEASVIARHLGGCKPRGPCCSFPGDPPGSCPARHLMCPEVEGCTGHFMPGGAKDKLKDPSVFSMSNLRDVVDRLVSGFFYTDPHSPPCAHGENVDYKSCFLEMTASRTFQNVASKMVSGHYAYDGKAHLCLEEDHSNTCTQTLGAVLRGACNLNFITMCETWQSSVLLLFETLPWIQPTKEFFPAPHHEDGNDPSARGGKVVASRHNDGAKHEEGIKHITPKLREAASKANAVDEALHEFVSAKFCQRLQDLELLDRPLVAEELAGYETLHQRCTDTNWITSTLERFKPLVPEDCRLYRPMAHP